MKKRRKTPVERDPVGKFSPKQYRQPVEKPERLSKYSRVSFKIDLDVADVMRENSVWDMEFPIITGEETLVANVKGLVIEDLNSFGEIKFEILDSNIPEQYSIGETMIFSIGEDSIDEVFKIEIDRKTQEKIRRDYKNYKRNTIEDRMKVIKSKLDTLRQEPFVNEKTRKNLIAEKERLNMLMESIENESLNYNQIEQKKFSQKEIPENLMIYKEVYDEKQKKIANRRKLVTNTIERLGITEKEWINTPLKERERELKAQKRLKSSEEVFSKDEKESTKFRW